MNANPIVRERGLFPASVRRSIAAVLCAVLPCAAAANGSSKHDHHGHAAHAAAGYAIQSLNAPLPDFVISGDTVTVRITGPSAGSLNHAVLRLNGRNVSAALQPDGAGAMTATVSGLRAGTNTFRLYRTKHADDAVAKLVVKGATTPALACAMLASLVDYPIQPSGTTGGTTITMAQLNPAATTGTNPLPEHCQVRGMLLDRTGVGGTQYRTLFELRLPTVWNGRYMFQGGGGTQGGLSNATGSQTGTSGYPMLRNGWAVVTENGGHDNALLPQPPPNILRQNMFYTDPQAVKDWGYNAIDVTTQTAKHLIDKYYARKPDRSYFVGCSTSGRQGMAMSQLFPTYYDGIVAGDPFYLPPDISLSETWSVQEIISIAPKDANGNPVYYEGFPLPDQTLFTNAILAACDAKDGLVDGVIEDMSICKFDPAKFVFPSSGPYGAIAPGQPLQCTGAKTPTCLTPAQVTAVKKIAEGPRTADGRKIRSPDGTVLVGYPFDGGFMQPQGIPTRSIGTPTSPPGNIGLGTGQMPLFWFTVPDPAFNPLTFDYDADMPLVTKKSPVINKSTDISKFVRRGGKLIFYHGLSDSGPPWPYTLDYVQRLEKRFGGRDEVENFAKLYLIPNMGHCGGNASTDRFDFLTPMVNWIENDIAPDSVIATGTNFTTPPTTRSRPLCAYPKTLRYTGPAGGDISLASNYTCQAPKGKPESHGHHHH